MQSAVLARHSFCHHRLARAPNCQRARQCLETNHQAPIALAYIDVATSASDMPGANMMGAAAQGAQSGGFFGPLRGLAKSAVSGASDRGNVFGNTRAMGFAMGRYVDVSVYASKNNAITEATQAIPQTMNLGESLRLIAPIPDKPVPTVIGESPTEPNYQKPKGKISIYWGCGTSIRPGQPRTLDVAKASLEDYGKFFIMRGKTTKGARSQAGHPAWPNKVDDRKIPVNASLVGQHSFIGSGIPDSFKVDLSAQQDLMPSIQLAQTKNDGGVHLEWSSIPYARGYFISAMGAQSDGGDSSDMVVWSSSELADMGFGLTDYQSNSDIDKWIGEKVILPAKTTTCDVPKGIFGDQAGGMLRMIAYGSDAFFVYPARPKDPKVAWEPDWQAKVRVKSTFSSMIGGFGDTGEEKQQRQAPEEKKKITPADLLKGLFGN
jgi:hypothetical protein